MRARVLKDWAQSYDPALKVARGDRLLAIREDNNEWAGWVWCTDECGLSGWLPVQVFDAVEISKQNNTVMGFNTVELTVHKGETLTIMDRLNGWSWCLNDCGQEGWVPQDCIGNAS